MNIKDILINSWVGLIALGIFILLIKLISLMINLLILFIIFLIVLLSYYLGEALREWYKYDSYKVKRWFKKIKGE